MGVITGSGRGAGGIILGARLERHGKTGMQQQLYGLLRDLILSGAALWRRPAAIDKGGRGRVRHLPQHGAGCIRAVASRRLCLWQDRVRHPGLPCAARAFAAGECQGPQSTRLDRTKSGLSKRGRHVEAISGVGVGLTPSFSPGMPAIDQFPFAIWSKLLAEGWCNGGVAAVGSDAGGYRPLREQITEYVSTARGMRCEADQVIIVSGNREGTELAARVLLDPGDPAIVEEPGYPGIRSALAAASVRAMPLSVDDSGLVLSRIGDAHRGARMMCIAPSHQYPLGSTTSLPRRLEILDWCRNNDCWIVEDDYDSEFRYSDRPLPSLQSLDGSGRVIYVGTFSKTLLPSLRIGYLIVPKPLIRPFTAMKLATSGPTTLTSQRAISRFIETGMFYRHVRMMRKLYAGRRAALERLIGRYLPELVVPTQEAAGLFMVALLRDDVAGAVSDVEIADVAGREGIHVEPLSRLYATDAARAGLIFGFGGLPENAMKSPVQHLARLVRRVISSKP